MPAVSEYAKKRHRQECRDAYHWYKDNGICPACKKEWSAPGHVYCEGCLKVRIQYNQKYGAEYNRQRCREYRERMKAAGRCVSCGKPAVPNRCLCAKCAKRNSEGQQVRNIRKRLAREAQSGKEVQRTV